MKYSMTEEEKGSIHMKFYMMRPFNTGDCFIEVDLLGRFDCICFFLFHSSETNG